MGMSYDRFYSIPARRARRSEIREILKLTRRPDMISFAGGLPDPGSFPVPEIGEITQAVLREQGPLALQYGPTEGDLALREELVRWVAKDGIEVDADQVFITNGSQQGLDLLGKIFVDPGDAVIVELPSYIGGLQAFNAYQAALHGVPQDDHGMRMDLLETKLAELAAAGVQPKMIYVVPDFQNPSGVTMPADRRRRLLELAREYDTLIIEDTPYRELRYNGEAAPAILASDRDGRVITISSFSKLFCPGFRLAWAMGPQDLISKLVIAKQSTDLCTASFTQAIAAEFMSRGLLHRQVERIRPLYDHKRQVMLEALEEFMPPGVTWTRPEGGLFLWVRLPEEMDACVLLREAVEHNVAFVIGAPFHCDGGGRNTMRLNFSYPSEGLIMEGIKRLAAAIVEQNRAVVTPASA